MRPPARRPHASPTRAGPYAPPSPPPSSLPPPPSLHRTPRHRTAPRWSCACLHPPPPPRPPATDRLSGPRARRRVPARRAAPLRPPPAICPAASQGKGGEVRRRRSQATARPPCGAALSSSPLCPGPAEPARRCAREQGVACLPRSRRRCLQGASASRALVPLLRQGALWWRPLSCRCQDSWRLGPSLCLPCRVHPSTLLGPGPAQTGFKQEPEGARRVRCMHPQP